MRQLPLAIVAAPSQGLDSFVIGQNAALLGLIGATPPLTSPLYLWGGEGSGKTHLLCGLAQQWQAGGALVSWFDASQALPWAMPSGCALLLLDDCDRLDAQQQHAAFTLLLEAVDQGVPWAAAGRVPPVDLALRNDLRSRLGWGMVFSVMPLDEAQTRAVLRRESDRRGVFLSDEVMDYLLTRFDRNLKGLMHLLVRLDDFALSEQRTLTVPLLKKMLVERQPA